jgi:LPPG:FO 2-phospho-L-lactate transferase
VLVALAGGVGAARFLAGLVRAVPPDEVVAIVNTGDDEEFHGLHVSPDLDSVTYTLAGASNAAQGWGLEGETFATLDALARYDVPTWFRLGDKDLATHLFRTQRLRAGATLSAVTDEITRAWGTRITVTRGDGHTEELAMQQWFVGERAESPVVSVRFDGAAHARPAPGVLEALRTADAIVICPSNPVISIGPILAVPGMREAIASAGASVVAVSPYVGGEVVKGPTDAFMRAVGRPSTAAGVASLYQGLIAGMVCDEEDPDPPPEGVAVLTCPTLMQGAGGRRALAERALEFSRNPDI